MAAEHDDKDLALHDAIRAGDFALCRQLLKRGAKNVRDDENMSAVDVAVECGYVDICALFLDHKAWTLDRDERDSAIMTIFEDRGLAFVDAAIVCGVDSIHIVRLLHLPDKLAGKGAQAIVRAMNKIRAKS